MATRNPLGGAGGSEAMPALDGTGPTRRRSIALMVTSVVGLAVFGTLALLVAGHPGPFGIDRAAAEVAEGIRSDIVTAVMRTASILGSSPSIGVQIAIIGGAIFFVRRDARAGLWLLAAFTGGWMLSNGFKALLDRPRPPAGLVGALGTSFPSGHATQGAGYFVMLGVVLAGALPPRWRTLGASVAIVVGVLSGLSRIYLHVHWLTDVVGGFGLGLAWTALLVWSRERRLAAEGRVPGEALGA
jgi:membrane-associated phospholipid phosphatase